MRKVMLLVPAFAGTFALGRALEQDNRRRLGGAEQSLANRSS